MGLQILHGDMVHIQKYLPRVRIDRQKAVMKEYVRLWLEAAIPYDGCYGDETRFNQNKGRFAANQFILHL
jgi:hypothetical protein